MAHDAKELLHELKFELRFLESGGYDPSVRESRKELTVFRDSPSCLNFAAEKREHPCSECWLIDFVPAAKRGEDIPCHHIPLNEFRETIAGMDGDREHMAEALKGWLRKEIRQLEAESRVPAHA
jgi:hypothetical protein